MFYVMPNYLTVDGQSQVKPVSWKEKFAMAAEGSFDPYEFTIVGIVAGIRQADNSSPAFGQEWKDTASGMERLSPIKWMAMSWWAAFSPPS